MRPLLATMTVFFAVMAGLGMEGALQWVDRPFSGFLVMDNGVIASAGLSDWPATRNGLVYQHEIVAVEGEAFSGSGALREQIQAAPIGTEITYRLRHEGRELDRTIATRRFEWRDFRLLFGAYFLNGILLAGAALALLRLRDRAQGAGAAAPLLTLSAVWALSAMDLYGPHRLFRVHVLAESLLFAAALHVAMGFPRPWAFVARRPATVWAPYAVAFALAVAYQLALYAPDSYVRLHLAAVGSLGLSLLVLIASQIGRLWAGSPAARRQIRVVALGSLLALAPAVWLSIAEPFNGGSSPQNVMAFTAFLFPVSIAWAVVRQPAGSVAADG